jgi:hypothetical protein
MDPAGRLLHHEQHVQPLQQQRDDAEEIGGENAAGLPTEELSPAGPVAAGAGSMPARLRIEHTVLAATW